MIPAIILIVIAYHLAEHLIARRERNANLRRIVERRLREMAT